MSQDVQEQVSRRRILLVTILLAAVVLAIGFPFLPQPVQKNTIVTHVQQSPVNNLTTGGSAF